jgi:hypothetical protein
MDGLRRVLDEFKADPAFARQVIAAKVVPTPWWC